MSVIGAGNVRMRELFDIPQQDELVGRVTLLDLFPEPQLVRVYESGVPVGDYMPLTAARGLVRALRARVGRRVSYSIRQPIEGGRGGNSVLVF